ncbi:MAG TPA: zf-HC2 domain-containing protein [Hyphomicrobiaceae bacterium]|nr:zf-HC2 domain-containing protein [Hyphomicrobiaceae bacterium]
MSDQDKISCEEVVAHLFDHLDGELDAKRRADIDRHLEECRGCCSRAEFERLIRQKIAALGSEPLPPTLQRRLMMLLDEF